MRSPRSALSGCSESPRRAPAAAAALRRYYARLTLDFQTNKRVCEEVAIIPSKGLKNKIAGYATVRSAHAARPPEPSPSLRSGAILPDSERVVALMSPPSSPSQHLMKRIQRGPVRGISLKLQEEERERRMDFVPEVSAVDTDVIEVDAETKAMLRSLDMGNLQGIVVHSGQQAWKGGKDRK